VKPGVGRVGERGRDDRYGARRRQRGHPSQQLGAGHGGPGDAAVPGEAVLPAGPGHHRRRVAALRGVHRGAGRGVRADLGRVAVAGEEQPAELGAGPAQLVDRADRHDPAAGQHRDPVGQLERGVAVRDDQRGPPVAAQPGVDLRLDARVDGRRGVVEQQHARVGQQRPGDRDALPLPPERVRPRSPITVS